MDEKTKAALQNQNAQIERTHSAGILLAKTHLAPYLRQLEKEQKFSRLELVCALLVTAYNLLRIQQPAEKAKGLYALLSNKSISYIERSQAKKLH